MSENTSENFKSKDTRQDALTRLRFGGEKFIGGSGLTSEDALMPESGTTIDDLVTEAMKIASQKENKAKTAYFEFSSSILAFDQNTGSFRYISKDGNKIPEGGQVNKPWQLNAANEALERIRKPKK
jgi:hypothetical protein